MQIVRIWSIISIQLWTDRDPARIILQIGTSDLKTQHLNAIADHIIDLARKIEKESNAQEILSEGVIRSDDVSNDSLKIVNKKLHKFCTQNGWQIVQHSKIFNNGPNRSGQYLNERGNNIVFNNFINCLSAHRRA